MHPDSILFKYPYLHPVAVVYSLLFLWCIDFRLRLITVICVAFIQFTIGESLKIHRHSCMQSCVDKLQIVAQFIGDILLIPYQLFIAPTESPLLQFQNTSLNRYIFLNCKSILKFTPTFFMRNTLMQFIAAVWEEQFSSVSQYKIYREVLETKDGGIIALDWWIDPLSAPPKPANNDDCKQEMEEEEKEEKAEFKDVYKSKFYHKFNERAYKREFQPMIENADNIPILFIFTTYCGDSMSMPVRKMADYFNSRGWRVVSYTKRGCGSPYVEMLPLANHKTFDLSGMEDAELAVQTVVNRFPSAPKICVGFSLGGSQLQDYLVRFNVERQHFVGAIKIDGISAWTELIKFGIRQNVISKVLGEVVHASYVKSLFGKDSAEIDEEKVAHWQQKENDCKGFDFAKIASVKSEDCEILDVVKMMMCPAAGHDDAVSYLHSVGPRDLSYVNVPTLVLNSWNDGFQDPADVPVGIANVNPYVFHCVTRLGAHCIRREGILFRDCWQSKVSFEFANAVVNAGKYRK